MAEYDYDLFVIGAGSGGVRAARTRRRARRQGRHRRGISHRRHLRDPRLRAEEAARLWQPLCAASSRMRAASAGPARSLRFDWPTLIGNVRREVDRLNGVYTRTLEKAGVDRFLTRASARRSATRSGLPTATSTVSAKTILVATGGHPFIPDAAGQGASHQLQRMLRAGSSCPRASPSSAPAISAWSSPRSSPGSA